MLAWWCCRLSCEWIQACWLWNANLRSVAWLVFWLNCTSCNVTKTWHKYEIVTYKKAVNAKTTPKRRGGTIRFQVETLIYVGHDGHITVPFRGSYTWHTCWLIPASVYIQNQFWPMASMHKGLSARNPDWNPPLSPRIGLRDLTDLDEKGRLEIHPWHITTAGLRKLADILDVEKHLRLFRCEVANWMIVYGAVSCCEHCQQIALWQSSKPSRPSKVLEGMRRRGADTCDCRNYMLALDVFRNVDMKVSFFWHWCNRGK